MSRLGEIKARAAVEESCESSAPEDLKTLIATLEAVKGVLDTMRQESGQWVNPEDHFARLLDEAITEALQ